MTNQRVSCLRFDDIRVEPHNFKVFKADSPLPLDPKTFLLLAYLIENRDRLVDKRELLDAIWKDVAVTENSLTREIGKLRRSLGDDPKTPKYIETVDTRGYRFIADVALGGTSEPNAEQSPGDVPALSTGVLFRPGGSRAFFPRGAGFPSGCPTNSSWRWAP